MSPPPPALKFIPAASLVSTPWRNGLGTSRPIIGENRPDGALDWQVNIAELERDASFSHYPGCDRVFTPLSGNPPPELAFNGGPFHPCTVLLPKRFSGDWATLSRVPAPGQAFNVIVDRQRHAARVSVLRLEQADPVSLPEATLFVLHCLSAVVRFGQHTVEPGDSLAGHGPALTGTATLSGVALLVEIRSATSQT